MGRYARRGGVRLDLVDVDTDPGMLERYGERVPVVLAADGAVLAEGRITKGAARKAVALARLPRN